MNIRDRRKRRPLSVAIATWLLAASAPGWAQRSADGVWDEASSPLTVAQQSRGPQELPLRYRAATLNHDALSRMATARPGTAGPTLELPLPDGGYSRFELTDAGVLPPGLAARFPGLASYRGHDAEGRRVRVDMAPDGVHAAVLDATGDWRVRPAATTGGKARGAASAHMVYRRADAAPGSRFEESEHERLAATRRQLTAPSAATSRGGATLLRDFRIAVTATSAYTARIGGSVADGLAGIVRTVNRVNDVFENDLGIHLVLAEDNDRLVFTDASNDPFAGLDDYAIALENTRVTDERLGQGAFDVGHVLDGQRESGVAGTLGNTCLPWSADTRDPGATKAAGMTGSTRPIGDDFHIDFVAHELGHQFGAHHTFNGCGANQRSDHPFEPGSGSTIMGYAGLCGATDLQPHSDPYFHAASIDQIDQWMAGLGGACAATRPNPSRAPTIDRQPTTDPIVVPARTPFRLAGSASFADDDARLTYTFEQMNAGPIQTSTLADLGAGPLFRSRPPTAAGEQSFPSMAVLLGDEPADVGDTLPLTHRYLQFRMTVRDSLDHRSHIVGTDRIVRVVDTGKAFEVQAPLANARVKRGKARQIRWNVAGTAKAPIACENVRVDLSLDGGHTFLDEPLLASVPNTGRASFTVPDGIDATHRGRLRVGCANGSFFALSPGDFDLR